MPKRKRISKRAKRSLKRRLFGGRRRKRSMFAMSRPTPLGKSFRFRTRYYEDNLSVNPAAGGLATSYLFHCNSLYDPNYSGSGHQPIGFDEIMPMYDHYTVIGSRIRVFFNNSDTASVQNCGIYINDTTSVTSNPQEIIENGLGKHMYLNKDGVGNDIKSMTLGFNTKKYFSVNNVMDNSDLKGTISSSPTEGAYFVVWAASASGGDTASVSLAVELEYIAILTEPKKLSVS